jgi:hypothetical protein
MSNLQRSPKVGDQLQQRTMAEGYGGMTFAESMQLCEMLAGSSFVPAAYKGKPGDIMAAVMLGHEVGLSPMAALQSIAVINGNPSIWGDGLWGIVLGHPEYVSHKESIDGDTKTAICTLVRKRRGGQAVTVTKTFSWDDATRAKLTGKKTYQDFPKDMLMRRARWRAAYASFADALRGIRCADIERDERIIEAEPIESSSREHETAKAQASAWGFDEVKEAAALTSGSAESEQEAEPDWDEVEAQAQAEKE